jgi:hypothetical protein
MKNKRIGLVALMLCCILTFNSIVPREDNTVKAFFPVVAGEALVYAICVSMGIYSASQSASDIASDIYTNLPSDLKQLADSKSSIAGDLNSVPVNLTRDQYNAFVQRIVQKFGVTPMAHTVNIDYGFGNIASTTSSYQNTTTPINIPSLAGVVTFNSNWVRSSWQQGNVTYRFESNNYYDWNTLFITTADGTQYKTCFYDAPMMMMYSSYTIVPTLYDVGTSNPNLRFWFNCVKNQNGIDYNYPSVIACGHPNYTYKLTNGEWVNVNNLFNDITQHLEKKTTEVNIDTEQYQKVVNDTVSNSPVVLNISKDMDKMVLMNAQTVTSINDVNNSVNNIGSDIVNGLSSIGTVFTNGLNALGTFIVNGINTAIGSITTGLTDILNAVLSIPQTMIDAFQDTLTWAFVPSATFWTDTFTAIRTPILNKYPMDISILSALSVGGDSFNDISVSAFYGNGQQAESAVIVKAKYINDNINWLRSATSCIWLFLLFVYVWKRFNGLLAGTNDYSVSQIRQNGGF